MEGLLILAALCVAFSNGANDNFKGVATLWGSQLLGYRDALLLATVAGNGKHLHVLSVATIWFARGVNDTPSSSRCCWSRRCSTHRWSCRLLLPVAAVIALVAALVLRVFGGVTTR